MYPSNLSKPHPYPIHPCSSTYIYSFVRDIFLFEFNTSDFAVLVTFVTMSWRDLAHPGRTSRKSGE